MNLTEDAYDMPTGMLLHEAQRQHAMAEITRDTWQQVLYERGAWFLLLVWAERTCGVKASPEASAWWALVMGAAASIEDAANCLRDPDAKKQADGAAKHYRDAAQKLMAASGVDLPDGAKR